MRLAGFQGQPGFRYVQEELANREALARLFDEVRPRRVIHLAAQSGVRRSLSRAQEYVDSNLAGFQSVLEGCGASGWSISSMPARPACMAAAPGCRTPSMTAQTIR